MFLYFFDFSNFVIIICLLVYFMVIWLNCVIKYGCFKMWFLFYVLGLYEFEFIWEIGCIIYYILCLFWKVGLLWK